MNPIVGIFYHAVGGFAAGSFYIPYSKVKNWAWEVYWLAGITWYLQFMFYGMGTTQMGAYDFASWSIHMAFIIIFSNMWGLILKEWKGSGKLTIKTIIAGLVVLILSTIIIGVGNYIQSFE